MKSLINLTLILATALFALACGSDKKNPNREIAIAALEEGLAQPAEADATAEQDPNCVEVEKIDADADEEVIEAEEEAAEEAAEEAEEEKGKGNGKGKKMKEENAEEELEEGEEPAQDQCPTTF